MLTSKEAKIPNNLISVAKKTPGMTAGIVCADHDSSMDSAKKSVELDLIKPYFIGDKNAINKTNTMALDRFNLEEKSRKPNIYNAKFTKPKYMLVFCVKLNISAKYCHILG